jgi:homoserine acetyltransferase
MILVGPSLGASVAIDFTVRYPEAVSTYLINYSLPFNSSTLQYAVLCSCQCIKCESL